MFCVFCLFRDLCGEKQTTGALLTKYARSSMQNGIKVFNSRRPVATWTCPVYCHVMDSIWLCCPRMTSAIIRLILLLTENVTIVGVQVFISLLYYSSLKSSKFKLATLNLIVKTCFITQTKQNLYLHCFFVCKKCIMLGIKFVLFCF